MLFAHFLLNHKHLFRAHYTLGLVINAEVAGIGFQDQNTMMPWNAVLEEIGTQHGTKVTQTADREDSVKATEDNRVESELSPDRCAVWAKR